MFVAKNDIVRLQAGIKGELIAGNDVFIPKGGKGTVVIVRGNINLPSAYEVEFFVVEQNNFALAAVSAELVCEI